MDELVEDIDGTIASENLNIRKLAREESEKILQKVSDKFNIDKSKLYPWESDYPQQENTGYGDNWDTIFTETLSKLNEELYLVVTDDERPPWQIYVGSPQEIKMLIEEQRFFEYFLFDIKMAVLVFDTHHNSLIRFYE